MIVRRFALVAVAALAAVSLVGCARPLVSGPEASTSPEIAGVTAVELATSGDLTITEGDPSLTITAPAGILDRLTSDVEAGVLVLGHRGGPLVFSGRISYELTLPSLDALTVNGAGDVTSSVSASSFTVEIHGAGDVEVTGIAASEVRVTISGAGDVELDGTAGTLTVEVDGAGEVDASELISRDAVVELSGAGDVEVHATGTLRATISGVGSVRYAGSPTVESEIDGLGEIEPAD